MRAEFDRLSTGVETSRSTFGGYRARRVFNLAGNSRAFDRLITDPLVITTVEAYLQDQIQLSEISSIQIEPGEVAQALHHDDGCYPLPRPHPPLVVSAIWALDPFTEANGASRVMPGSHLEKFLHTDTALPPLIEIALVHYSPQPAQRRRAGRAALDLRDAGHRRDRRPAWSGVTSTRPRRRPVPWRRSSHHRGVKRCRSGGPGAIALARRTLQSKPSG